MSQKYLQLESLAIKNNPLGRNVFTKTLITKMRTFLYILGSRIMHVGRENKIFMSTIEDNMMEWRNFHGCGRRIRWISIPTALQQNIKFNHIKGPCCRWALPFTSVNYTIQTHCFRKELAVPVKHQNKQEGMANFSL